MNTDAPGLPGAQRVALDRVLDLDHLGAEIGELRRHGIAGDEPRQIDDPDAVERTDGIGLERSQAHAWHRFPSAEWPTLSPAGWSRKTILASLRGGSGNFGRSVARGRPAG